MLAPQRRALLWKKLLICGVRFDFSRSGEDDVRDLKRNTLLELTEATEMLGSAKEACVMRRQLFNDPKCLQDTINMISTNLFRALPNASNVESEWGV